MENQSNGKKSLQQYKTANGSAAPLSIPAAHVKPGQQGTTNLAPPDWLGRVTKRIQTDADASHDSSKKLLTTPATLLIQKWPTRLYHAILEYTAMYYRELKHEEIEPISLAVHPDDCYERRGHRIRTQESLVSKSDSDSEEDEGEKDNTSDTNSTYSISTDSDSTDRAGDGALLQGYGPKIPQPIAPVPIFKFGRGEAMIKWPPPKELRWQVLKNKGSDDEKNDDDGSVETVLNLDEEEAEEQDTIYLIHYTYGDPIAGSIYIEMFQEILLASGNGYDALTRFTTEVIEWRIAKNFRLSDVNSFLLYRFMSSSSGDGWWNDEGMKVARKSSSVILANDQLDVILTDMEKFLDRKTRKWYLEHGLPHRRCYLFHGPPGTGKTSTIRVIASKFCLTCCYLSLTNSSFNNQALGDALSKIPPLALLVIEDVDTLYDEENTSGNGVTVSGLLNALDGIISAEGIITILTTNHVDKLDETLIRGGRVDKCFFFGYPLEKELKKMFMSFYPNSPSELCDRFSKNVITRGDEKVRSMATLQQLFIDYREQSGEECVEGMEKWFEQLKQVGMLKEVNRLYI